MKRLLGIAALGCLLAAGAAQAEMLTNDSVIQLAEIGLGDEALIAKIKTSENTFDVSTDALVALKGKGLSSPVIAEMISASAAGKATAAEAVSFDSPNPSVPHPAGVYLLVDWKADLKMQVIDPTTSNQTKTGGMFGYLMTGGLASMSYKTVLPNASARTGTPIARPVFYFYFNQPGGAQPAGGGFWMAGNVASPNEFNLVKFQVKKNAREAKVGSFNIGGAKAGVMEKDRIPFSYSQVSPGVYRVQPDLELTDGEYGFLYSSSTGGGPGLAGAGAQTARIFDFSVDSGVPEKKKKS